MLQNSRVTASTVSELLRESQHGRGTKLPHPPLELKFTQYFIKCVVYLPQENFFGLLDLTKTYCIHIFWLLGYLKHDGEKKILRLVLGLWKLVIKLIVS